MNESHSCQYSSAPIDNYSGTDYSYLPSIPGWVFQSVLQNMPHAARTNFEVQSVGWRDLHLSKAKLKASSRTSALLSGFAMEEEILVKNHNFRLTKLKWTDKTSALISGFAMVAMVEMQMTDNIPGELLVAFSICTTLLVAVHMLALMISTCILPHIEAISNMHNPDVILESPHEKMRYYIEMAWAFSTVFGILLFLCEIAIICWVKFLAYNKTAAISSTVLLVPVLIVFVAFAVHFYRKLVGHHYDYVTKRLRELQENLNDLDGHGNNAHTALQTV